MASLNGSVDEIEVSPAIFSELSNLEKEFAEVELDALRRKEYALQSLYNRRSKHLSQIPGFWPQVLLNGPQEFQSILALDSEEEDSSDTSIDLATISAIQNLTIERHGIKSAAEGDPRSLRFVFEFGKNAIFEDTKVVKDFNYVSFEDGDSGALVSKPVTFKWTKKGKKLMSAHTGGVLDLAVELYAAEEAAKFKVADKNGKKGGDVDMVERENLWQYEKLRSKLEEIEDSGATESSWLDWFGYRGPVEVGSKASSSSKTASRNGKKTQNGNGTKSADEDEDTFENLEDEDSEAINLLDVEIFPSGEELAIALAEDLWPNVMDYFMASQEPDDDDDEMGLNSDDEEDEDDDDEAPALIDTAGTTAAAAPGTSDAELDTRPSKKQRTSK